MTLPDVTAVDSLAPVERAFDAPAQRVLAVLSPTHPACVSGVQALGTALDRRGGEARALVVWTPVRPGDDRDQLVKATMHLPSATHFVDEQRLVGRAVAEAVLDADAVAWDAYLFYGPDATWDDLGEPAVWLHGHEDCDATAGGHYYGNDREAAFEAALASVDRQS